MTIQPIVFRRLVAYAATVVTLLFVVSIGASTAHADDSLFLSSSGTFVQEGGPNTLIVLAKSSQGRRWLEVSTPDNPVPQVYAPDPPTSERLFRNQCMKALTIKLITRAHSSNDTFEVDFNGIVSVYRRKPAGAVGHYRAPDGTILTIKAQTDDGLRYRLGHAAAHMPKSRDGTYYTGPVAYGTSEPMPSTLEIVGPDRVKLVRDGTTVMFDRASFSRPQDGWFRRTKGRMGPAEMHLRYAPADSFAADNYVQGVIDNTGNTRLDAIANLMGGPRRFYKDDRQTNTKLILTYEDANTVVLEVWDGKTVVYSRYERFDK